jgi:hypothetical protein
VQRRVSKLLVGLAERFCDGDVRSILHFGVAGPNHSRHELDGSWRQFLGLSSQRRNEAASRQELLDQPVIAVRSVGHLALRRGIVELGLQRRQARRSCATKLAVVISSAIALFPSGWVNRPGRLASHQAALRGGCG